MEKRFRITLRAARVNAGLTLPEAADRLRIGKSTLQSYESGRSAPRWDTVQRMQEVYGIESKYLFFERDIA